MPCPLGLRGSLSPDVLGPVLWLQGSSLFPEGAGALWEAPKTVRCQAGTVGVSGGSQSGRLRSGVPVAAGRGKRAVTAPVHPTRLLLMSLQLFVKGQRGSHPPLPVPPLPAGTSGADGRAAPGTRSPYKASRGGGGGASVACPAPRAPWDGWVVGWEEGAPSTQLSGPGLGSAERVPGTAALCRESQGGWFASRSPKLFGDTASPATSSSSPPRLRHQTFTNAPAGTFLGVDVLFWFGSNLFPVDTAAALLELAGPEQG